MKTTLLFQAFILFLSTSAMALVDYTGTSSSAPVREQSTPSPVKKFTPSKQISSSVSRSSGAVVPSGMFNVSTSFESLTIENSQGEGKVNFLNFKGKFETGYGIFLDVDYYGAKSSDKSLGQSSSFQKGNPEAIVGFHWLNFGDSYDKTTVDLYAGASLGIDDSDFASSRADKVFGIETTKAMGMMGLGFGYELRMTGSASRPNEADIGSVQRLKAAMGLVVSNDIQVQVEAGYVRIGAGKEDSEYALRENISYGELVPRLLLGVSPLIKFELSGRFRTNRQKNPENLLDTHLWRERGLYGNSIQAGMHVSL